MKKLYLEITGRVIVQANDDVPIDDIYSGLFVTSELDDRYEVVDFNVETLIVTDSK